MRLRKTLKRLRAGVVEGLDIGVWGLRAGLPGLPARCPERMQAPCRPWLARPWLPGVKPLRLRLQ